MKNPKITIVLPTYNQAKYINRCIDSVLEQSFTDDLLKAYDDPRIRVVTKSNSKLPAALNTGFKTSKGQYLTWVSSDCFCEENYLQELNSALDENSEIGLIYSNFRSIDKNYHSLGLEKKRNIEPKELLITSYIGASFMYRRSCLEAIGCYDEDLEGTEDWDYWIRIANEFQLLYLNKVLYNYMRHKESMSFKLDIIKAVIKQKKKNAREHYFM
jgi:glycosyltransferase involved in cell wall biosynthesis